MHQSPPVDAAGSAPPATHDGRWHVKLIRRCTIAGTRWRAGAVIGIPRDRLRVAAHLIRTGAAKAANDDTREAVAMFELVRRLP